MRNKIISRADAASLLGCTPQTISNYINKGLLSKIDKGYKGTFVYAEEIQAIAPHSKDISQTERKISEYQLEIERKN